MTAITELLETLLLMGYFHHRLGSQTSIAFQNIDQNPNYILAVNTIAKYIKRFVHYCEVILPIAIMLSSRTPTWHFTLYMFSKGDRVKATFHV